MIVTIKIPLYIIGSANDEILKISNWCSYNNFGVVKLISPPHFMGAPSITKITISPSTSKTHEVIHSMMNREMGTFMCENGDRYPMTLFSSFEFENIEDLSLFIIRWGSIPNEKNSRLPSATFA